MRPPRLTIDLPLRYFHPFQTLHFHHSHLKHTLNTLASSPPSPSSRFTFHWGMLSLKMSSAFCCRSGSSHLSSLSPSSNFQRGMLEPNRPIVYYIKKMVCSIACAVSTYYILYIKWYACAAPTVEKEVRSDSLAGDFRKLLQSPLFNLDN